MKKDIWFTSDTHAWHTNIIKYCNRPWDNAHDMTHAIADNINACVPANGTLYHLGDFSWGNAMWIEGFRNMINCKKVVLILGNHDRRIEDSQDLRKLFHGVHKIYDLDITNRKKIVLCHYSMRVWNASFHGSWHLYGHSHGTLSKYKESFDVGVDCHDYKPISLAQVHKRMRSKEGN